MEVTIISRKIVKPSSPTPLHLQTLRLSLLDQLAPHFHGAIIFFYPNNGDALKPSQRVSHLQESLSKTLSHFYPFAGKINEDNPIIIDCSDDGAYLIEAQCNSPLADVISEPDHDSLNHFIPMNDEDTIKIAINCMLLVQVTVFNCGGLAVTLSPSYKIADGASVVTFIKAWTSMARLDGELVMPEFVGAEVLPPRPLAITPSAHESSSGNNMKTKRFVFDVSKLGRLRAQTAMVERFSPTNVEIIMGLILKTAMSAYKSKTGSSRLSIASQIVNLRGRMEPPLSETAIGNFIWSIWMFLEGNEVKIHELVANSRKRLSEFFNEKAKRIKGEEGYYVVSEYLREREQVLQQMGEMNAYMFRSMCRFPFYEMDFGWGNPGYVHSPSSHKNLSVLMDSKLNDGIEAWVTLDEQEMAIFESNQELLAYASLNPKISI